MAQGVYPTCHPAFHFGSICPLVLWCAVRWFDSHTAKTSRMGACSGGAHLHKRRKGSCSTSAHRLDAPFCERPTDYSHSCCTGGAVFLSHLGHLGSAGPLFAQRVN